MPKSDMPAADRETGLKAGISALKAGERARARELLLHVVTADEANEIGWLWLSAAVDSAEDRRICLENVLALNPDNGAARRGLAKLDLGEGGGTAVSSPPTAASAPTIIRREIPANTLAAAILYPERQIQEQEWRDPTRSYAVQTAGLKHTSSYHDVWERDCDLCAYCAHEINAQTNTCPGCGRKLVVSAYRYEKPGANLHILWVLLVAIAQLYLVQGLYDVIIRQRILFAVLPGCLMGLFLILAVGVYFRQFWAYAGAIASLSIILFVNLLGFFIPAELTATAITAVGPMLDAVVNPVLGGLANFLRIFQLATIGLALLVAVLKAGPDFERIQHRQVAVVQKGIQTAGGYHAAAARAAKRGEWATAVLHWQRAAAKAPGQISFQRQLAGAYARLGFYQRSANILQAALPLTNAPAQQDQLQRMLTAVTAQLNSNRDQKETNHA